MKTMLVLVISQRELLILKDKGTLSLRKGDMVCRKGIVYAYCRYSTGKFYRCEITTVKRTVVNLMLRPLNPTNKFNF